jgi:hypothetical protein
VLPASGRHHLIAQQACRYQVAQVLVESDHQLAVLHLCRLHLQGAEHPGHGRVQLVDRFALGVVAQPRIEQATGARVEAAALVGRGEVIHARLLQVEALGLRVVAQAAAELHRAQSGRVAAGGGQRDVHAQVQPFAGRKAQLRWLMVRAIRPPRASWVRGKLPSRYCCTSLAPTDSSRPEMEGRLCTDRSGDQHGGGREAGHQGTQAHVGDRWEADGWIKE